MKSEPGSGLPGSLAVATRTVAELFSGTEKAWAVMLSDCSPTVAVVVGVTVVLSAVSVIVTVAVYVPSSA